MKQLFCIFLISVLTWGSALAQFKNNVWCFGDSAGMKFDQGSIQLFNSSTLTRGGSCSISDSSGNLLFYANTDYYQLWIQGYVALGVVWDRNHNLMQNGDTLVGDLMFQEQVIVPWPDSSNLFYIFTSCLFFPEGFWYSVVDMNQNGGLGAVVQKNVQLTNFKASDCVAAVRHGNGRDWWVFFRRWDTVNDEYYRFLVSPSGISGPFIQNIGTTTDNGFMHSTFSKDGGKYLVCDYRGLIELYNFDRCTGLFTNVTQIEPEQPPGSFPAYFGCEFSASGRYIYVSSNNDVESLIVQFDLWAPNISSSKDTIVYLTIPPTGGLLKRGPDDKIYFSCVYNDGINVYPYPETATSIYNLNLSVINDPDSAGASCNFTPFSFNLGGNETYWGLPNNPDYDLPALAGSPCDTLVSIGEAPQMQQATINVFYHTAWEKAFINASNLKGKTGKLLVFDMQGKMVHQEPLRIQNGYYTKDLSMQGKAHGVYLVIVQTEEERLARKMITD